MKQLLEGFVKQLRHAVEIGEHASVTFPATHFANVIITGMGASGAGASLVQAYVANKLQVPVIVNKCYDVPEFVSNETLFIAISLSGNAEETISGVRKAMECGATVCFVTSGGEIKRIALENELPHVFIPVSEMLSRSYLGYSSVALLYLLHYAGLLGSDFKTELEQSITLLESNTGSMKVQASVLANTFHNSLPVVYSSDRFEPVASRLQQQLNTNAKQLCHINVMPEACHNEIEGWQYPEMLYKHIVALLIKSDYDHPRVHLRMDLCKKLLAGRVQNVLEIKALGATFLEQAFYLINIFDWVSVYLADLNNSDPNKTDNIDYLKSELSKS